MTMEKGKTTTQTFSPYSHSRPVLTMGSILRNILMSLTFFIAAISFFVLPHVAATGMIMLLAALIGVAFGTQFAVSAPLVTDCFGLAHFGAIFGLVFTAYGFLSGLIGPSLSGYLLDLTHGNFVVVYTYLGVFCLISSGLILGVRKVA